MFRCSRTIQNKLTSLRGAKRRGNLTVFLVGLLLFLIVSGNVVAQNAPVGPVGPKAPAPTLDEDGEPKPVEVDLPYKPAIPQPPKEDPEDDEPVARPPPPPPEPVIPYIPSKSPEPLGASDPTT